MKELRVEGGSTPRAPFFGRGWNRDLYNFLDNVRPIYRAEKGREMMAQLEKVEKKYAR